VGESTLPARHWKRNGLKTRHMSFGLMDARPSWRNLGRASSSMATRNQRRSSMMRMRLNLGLPLLLVVTLLWGGCLSCSQYFMFPSSHAGCCNPAGHCGETHQSPAKSCHIQPFAPAKTFSGTIAQSTLSAVALPLPIEATNQASAFGARLQQLFSPQPSPPDLCLLHSVLRI
jgi:hypothetical protein